MTQTIAKIRKGSNHYEVLVNMDEALKFKKGENDYLSLEIDRIFTDANRGEVASTDELETHFGTSDPLEVGKQIVKQGEVLVDKEHRDEEKEKRIKQVVEFLTRNAIDPKTGNPHTSERIKNALEQAHVNIKNVPVENQIQEIIEKISGEIPIKLETKRVKITVPAIQTGKVYGLVTQYKEKEEWLNDGSLEIIVKVPAGLIIDFYDKLNSMTHGSAVTEELKEE
jgi:ribosome maturation protein SDO1